MNVIGEKLGNWYQNVSHLLVKFVEVCLECHICCEISSTYDTNSNLIVLFLIVRVEIGMLWVEEATWNARNITDAMNFLLMFLNSPLFGHIITLRALVHSW